MCISHIWFACQPRVVHMLTTCGSQLHVVHMLTTCGSHVNHMWLLKITHSKVTCVPHVNHMCFYHMWITCEMLFQFHT